METLLRRDTVVGIIRATIVIQLATLVACYAIWVVEGCDPFVPFISDTDTNSVSGAYFTIGFTISGILLTIIGAQSYFLRRNWAASNMGEGSIGTLNLLSSISAIVAGMSLAWIADTPWHEQMELHLVQARLVFGGSIVWAISSTLISSRMAEADPAFSELTAIRRRRTSFTFLCMVVMVVSVVSYSGISLAVPASYLDLVRVCTELDVTALSIAATFEWLVAFGLIGVIETCIEETRLLSDEP